ncbi:transglycosylase SLT domain-containing protein [Marinimicrobium alkaliphilum]|uniref:transglycosylase SLT domain-containing protein n=1 Tax=Marinimicrobium alkaliphilum TaxID=2202654 RepID=UPI000DBA13E1|nr:transglycosylase SLT domain-containing protein [Marinimicrobium alkaliphilum]
MRALSALLFSTLLATALAAVPHKSYAQPPATQPTDAEAELRAQQRNHYNEARIALERRQLQRYREHLDQLGDYPLRPYLEYTELTRRLGRLPKNDISAFLEAYPNSLLAERLHQQWLRTLGEKQQWADYLYFWNDSISNTDLNCYHLEARHREGDGQALAQAAPLWLVGHSQPDACDGLFSLWLESDQFTPELAWERHRLALEARNGSLAGYINRLMPESWQAQAALLRDVDRQPELLRQQVRFAAQTPQMQDIILHGLHRLAVRDAKTALTLWRRYDAQQLFDDQRRLALQQEIAARLLRQGEQDAVESLLAEVPQLNSETLIERLLRDQLRQQDWSAVTRLIAQLPEEAQASHRWRYWQARAHENLDHSLTEGAASARSIYAELANTRSFYGFMAADILGIEYRLIDRPVQAHPGVVRSLELHPAIRRARELYIVGEITDANREWFHALGQMNTQAILAAGRLAEQWGWHRKSIHAMIQARSWDDLQLRFPLAYQEQVTQAAADTAINPYFLYAIARQESAFMPDARSPAGALGLMQLMPSTARYTARRAGIPYHNQHDLLSPDRNIQLGSRYLNQLLEEFDGNRILAAAAYNAGPTRVRRWLRESSQPLPYDVWIETIPFQETRGYVQNVLTFSVIYGYRMGESLPLVTLKEASNPL